LTLTIDAIKLASQMNAKKGVDVMKSNWKSVATLVNDIGNKKNTAYNSWRAIDLLALNEQEDLDLTEFMIASGNGCEKCDNGFYEDMGMGVQVCEACGWNEYTERYDHHD
jgi:hypothetical protein